MHTQGTILTLLASIAINLLLLIAVAVFDIILSAFILSFSSLVFTITCFAMAGLIAGLFCFSSAMLNIAKEQKEKAALFLVISIIALCILLFFVVASFSGWDYYWPVKFFSVAEAAIVLFLWKNKIYQNEKSAAQSENQ